MANSILGSDCFRLGQSMLGDVTSCAGGGPPTEANITGSGGVRVGGSAGVILSASVAGTGGVVAGGTGGLACRPAVSGGVLIGGACGVAGAVPCSGGAVVGGSASVVLSAVVAGSAGCVVGGNSTNVLAAACTGTGGVVCGSAAGVVLSAVVAGAAGCVVGGDGSTVLAANCTGSGGVVIGGAAVATAEDGDDNSETVVGSGGMVAGGEAGVILSAVFATDGGCVTGGDGGQVFAPIVAGQGGVVTGSAAGVILSALHTGNGGCVAGGLADYSAGDDDSATVVGTGGVVVGGSAAASLTLPEESCCNFSETITGSGGVTIGGSAIVVKNFHIATGGVSIGGSATVKTSNVFDGYSAIYHLLEQGAGIAAEFKDSSGHNYHGQGGLGFSDQCPARVPGVFYFANEFDGRDFIKCPEFGFTDTSPLTVSTWGRRTNQFLQRVWYSIGHTNGLTPEGWQIQIGHDSRNRPMAKVQVVEGDDWATYSAIGSTVLDADCWYNLAATWEPGAGLTLFLNGELEAFTTVSATRLVPSTSGSYIGRRDNVEYAQAKLQELRIAPSVLSDEWLAADYATFCDEDFYTVGAGENPVYSVGP